MIQTKNKTVSRLIQQLETRRKHWFVPKRKINGRNQYAVKSKFTSNWRVRKSQRQNVLFWKFQRDILVNHEFLCRVWNSLTSIHHEKVMNYGYQKVPPQLKWPHTQKGARIARRLPTSKVCTSANSACQRGGTLPLHASWKWSSGNRCFGITVYIVEYVCEDKNWGSILYCIVSNINVFCFVENDQKIIEIWISLVSKTKMQEIRWYYW